MDASSDTRLDRLLLDVEVEDLWSFVLSNSSDALKNRAGLQEVTGVWLTPCPSSPSMYSSGESVCCRP
jgi:hypothetical protein